MDRPPSPLFRQVAIEAAAATQTGASLTTHWRGVAAFTAAAFVLLAALIAFVALVEYAPVRRVAAFVDPHGRIAVLLAPSAVASVPPGADVQLAFPAILLAILLASVLGSSLWNVIVVISITSWVVFARVTRSQVLTLRNREYVEAARTLGAGRRHLIFRTLLPGCVAPILVVATVEFGHVVLLEAALSFLGVGVPLGIPSLGSTIHNGTAYLATAWWISTLPGIALAILVLATGILGDALRDRFDPRLRSA